jgi:hypothetical protein
VANQANALAASNGTTVIVTGVRASMFTQNNPIQMILGHPDQLAATIEGFGLMMETPALRGLIGFPLPSTVENATAYGPVVYGTTPSLVGTYVGGGASATAYGFAGIPSAPVVNTTYTVTVFMIGGTTSASGVVTFAAASGIVWGGTVAIGSGGSDGTTTVTFTAAGSYTISATHTGLGFSGDPGNQSVTAVSGGGGGGGGGAATLYGVSGIPANPIVGANNTGVTVSLNGLASASGVVTFGANSNIVWGPPVSIALNGYTGTTSVTFTAPGTYSLGVSHTGLGFGGDPSLGSVTAVNPVVVTPTVTLSVDKVILGTGGTVTYAITPNGAITDSITITPSGPAAAGLSAQVKTFTNSNTPQTGSFSPTTPGQLILTMTDSAGNTLVNTPISISYAGQGISTNLGLGNSQIFTTYANLSASGSGVVVPAVSGKRIVVLSYQISCGPGTSIYFLSSGGSIISATSVIPASGAPYSVEFNPFGYFSTNVGESLEINLLGAVALGLTLQYALV